MSLYRVTVEETTVIRRCQEIEADSLQDAREIAEEQDWGTYEDEDQYTNSTILEVEYVGEKDEGEPA